MCISVVGIVVVVVGIVSVGAGQGQPVMHVPTHPFLRNLRRREHVGRTSEKRPPCDWLLQPGARLY